MSGLAKLVATSVAEVGGQLERALFRSDDPQLVADVLAGHVLMACGAGPAEALIYRTGVGLVAGFELDDGRRVLAKVHRWNVTASRLAAVQRMQSHAAAAGLPAPRPLAPPMELGNGLATVEEYLPGDRANGRDPPVRRMLAEQLHRFIEAVGSVRGADVARPLMIRPTGAPLWPEPHALRFDFEATQAGAEWIDRAAASAQLRLRADISEDVIGHFDWRVENLGFADGRLVAIYDWDSVAAASESVVVGATAAQFCIDWTSGDPDPVPVVDEMRAFAEDYEHARGQRFDRDHRMILDAANLALIAYGARCQHSDLSLHPELGRSNDVGWLRLLRERVDETP